MTIFDHEFHQLAPELLEDLENLQAEGAVYRWFFLHGAQEPKFYRIRFRPAEIVAYVRAAMSWDEFLGHCQDTGDVVAALGRLSDTRIQSRVREHICIMESRGLGNDHYCFAAFMSDDLESLLFGSQLDRYEFLFEWPTTDVTSGIDDGIQGVGRPWPEIGLLKYMGYAVGETGASAFERQRILKKVLTEPVPNVDSPGYMAQWGTPGSVQRLRKLVDTLAAFVRNSKRKKEPPEEAIRDWESDLAWLKDKFHDGDRSFSWPSL